LYGPSMARRDPPPLRFGAALSCVVSRLERGRDVGLAKSDFRLAFVPRVVEVRELSPSAPGINPDRAISAKGDDLARCQRRDLFDFSGPINLRWVGLRHHGSV
jgi:hypothetical protein